MCDAAIHEFVINQRELLELELKSEEEEERSISTSADKNGSKNTQEDESPSHLLRNLDATEVSVGLYGRTVVTLTVFSAETSENAQRLLPAHRFSVGDEVEIHSKSSSKKDRRNNSGGVISCITDLSVSVALFSKRGPDNDESDESPLDTPPLSLVPKGSVEVHKKLVQALDELQEHGVDHPVAGSVIRSLFGPPSNFPELQSPPKAEPLNANLDASQLEAISFALDNPNRPIALIHGPPGTGKTTTIAELIYQAVTVHDCKVLVTAPSNVAVDNVLERLVQMQSMHSTNKKRSSHKKRGRSHKLKMVRLGHPARIKASILPYSLESLVQNAEGTEIVADVRQELQSFLRILSNPKSRSADKRLAYREMKSLRKEVKTRETRVVQELLSSAQVILATTVGAANRLLKDLENGFDLVVIDEAAQALEASCWIPMLQGRRVVLAGDHCQLPPTIKNRAKRVQQGLGKTLFERGMELYGDDSGNGTKTSKGKISRMLQVQYRMHQTIADWASEKMYNCELQTYEGVKGRTLSQLDHVNKQSEEAGNISKTALLLIDTTGCGMHETVNAAGSRYNEGEASLVCNHVHSLIAMGLKAEEIAVISPYNGQVELLRQMLLPDIPKLEIRSVDGFQGGEREAVVLSLVRSSDRGGSAGIGFLKDNRRLNVAVTRAKRQCVLICDCETVSRSGFIEGLILWMEEHGEYRSAVEYTAASEQHDFEGDLLDAEKVIARMVEAGEQKADSKERETRMSVKPTGMSIGTPSLSPNNVGQERTEEASARDEAQQKERRKALMTRISDFAETAEAGDELRLSPELSRFDRRVVHEFCTELGLGHRSEGVDGVDRRIIIEKKREASVAAPKNVAEESNEVDAAVPMRPRVFAALDLDSDESSSESDHEKGGEKVVSEPATTDTNNLLAGLARERMQRQPQKPPPTTNALSKKKKNKKNGQKLGGGAPKPATKDVVTEFPDDDMAFLDAQIEKVQTSHGRKVEGKGSYKSIVNGILLAKPPPPSKEKNTRSSSALNAKLKQAQDGRKKKGKKKK